MAETECIDLLTLQESIADGLGNLFPEALWVRAEVAQIQVRQNGHCYLDLVQSNDGKQVAKAKAVIWRSRYGYVSEYFRSATGSGLATGQQILALVEVNYSELYGLSLVITDIDAEFTVGAAELQKQQTIERLRSEGLLEKQQSVKLAAIPYKLAVISAEDAAGFGDFRRHLAENGYGFFWQVELFQAKMQGETAPDSIMDALERIEVAGGFDAVLLMRGGGSNLDLACFDNYDLAFAIANCPLPVFTAIGHDKDYHVADMVAWKFVKTPTALSDFFIDINLEADAAVSELESRIRTAAEGRIAAAEQRIKYLLALTRQAVAGKIALQEEAIGRMAERIFDADPRRVLERGYILASDEGGRVIKSASQLKAGNSVSMIMKDGRAELEVKSVKLNKGYDKKI